MSEEFLPVENYVPHRGAMLLLDRLVQASADHAVAELKVPRDGLFITDAGMPAWVGLEYMAQTVAAWAGWTALQAGQPVKLGFLLGTRKFEALTPFYAPDAVLTVHAHCELMGVNGLGMFDCRIDCAGDALATARISVFEPEDGNAYIQKILTSEPATA